MAGPQPDKSKKASIDGAFDEVLKGVQTGRLLQLETVRNDLDSGVGKLLSLTPRERSMLALTAQIPAGFCAELERPLLNPTSPGFAEELKGRSNPLVDSLCTMAALLPVNNSKAEEKRYEALVQKVWKATKSQLDTILETPESKQLLKAYKALPAVVPRPK